MASDQIGTTQTFTKTYDSERLGAIMGTRSQSSKQLKAGAKSKTLNDARVKVNKENMKTAKLNS